MNFMYMCFTLSDPAAACKNKYLYLVVPEFIYGKNPYRKHQWKGFEKI